MLFLKKSEDRVKLPFIQSSLRNTRCNIDLSQLNKVDVDAAQQQ
jgi:hypothetical protein